MQYSVSINTNYYLILGEQAVREEFPEAVIFRPADMYGNADRFLRYYAAFWRGQFKGMPLWKKGEATIKQPVFVSDVAQAILNAAREVETNGKTYQAVGFVEFFVHLHFQQTCLY